MRSAIGIDFGTTNTRLAFCDGTQVRILTEPQAVSPFIPSAIAYRQGRPIAYGQEARTRYGDEAIASLKWLLAQDVTLDVGIPDRGISPIGVVADFVGHLKRIFLANRVDPEEHMVAVTVPVGYPLRARRALVAAFRKGGVPINVMYPEPVAALYSAAAAIHGEGVCAILDWGGGTLDIACLRIKEGKAYVLSTEGLKEGGDDFDAWIARDALNGFLSRNLDLQNDRDLIWKTKQKGLLLRAEGAKWDYIHNPILRWDGFVGNYDLEYRLDADLFLERLKNPVSKAIRLFSKSVKDSGELERLIKPIILSGGTRNLDFIRYSLEGEFGDRIIDELPQTGHFRDVDRNRIDSATALGAALLMATESRPVFSRSIGVRMADARNTADMDLFWPIFRQGEVVQPNRTEEVELFVTNPSCGVARLLICDQLEPDLEPAGRLLRFFPVPVSREEKSIFAKFRVTEDLLLEVTVIGAIARIHPEDSRCYVANLAFGFDLPSFL